MANFNNGQSSSADNLIREYLIRYISVNCPKQKPSFAKPTESSLQEWISLSGQLFEFCTQENIYPQLQALAAPANSGHNNLSSSPSAVLTSESPPQPVGCVESCFDDNAANPQSRRLIRRSNTTSLTVMLAIHNGR